MTAVTTEPTEKTGARTAEAAELISDARERIDALDDRIIGLVQERMAVSAVIQKERIASGGRRVNLSARWRFSPRTGTPWASRAPRSP